MSIVHDSVCIVYSPTGEHFASWDRVETLYLYNGKTGEKITHINEHKNVVIHPVFSPNGEILAHGIGENDVIFLRNASTGVIKHSLTGHEDIPIHMSFASDGIRLASISWDQTVRVWNTKTGESMASFFTGYTGDVYLPVLSPDWRKLVTITSASHQLNLHDVEAGTMQGVHSFEETPLTDFARPTVAFSPNGDTMACGFLDLGIRCELHLWRLDTCSRVGVPMVGHQGGIRGLSFSPDASLLASASEDFHVRLWDGYTGAPFAGPFYLQEPYHVRFSPDSRFISSSGSCDTKVWNVHTGECVWSISEGGVFAFSSDSDLLAASYKGELCLWKFSSGSSTPISSTKGAGHLDNLTFDPMGCLLVSASGGKIKLWSAADDLQLLSEISALPRAGSELGVSLDSRFLAFGSLVWDISSFPKESPVLVSIPGEATRPLDWRLFPHSLLTYHDGWIHSASPSGRLLPIPGNMWDLFANNRWHAHGNKVVVWDKQRLPIIIDCQPLLLS